MTLQRTIEGSSIGGFVSVKTDNTPQPGQPVNGDGWCIIRLSSIMGAVPNPNDPRKSLLLVGNTSLPIAASVSDIEIALSRYCD